MEIVEEAFCCQRRRVNSLGSGDLVVGVIADTVTRRLIGVGAIDASTRGWTPLASGCTAGSSTVDQDSSIVLTVYSIWRSKFRDQILRGGFGEGDPEWRTAPSNQFNLTGTVDPDFLDLIGSRVPVLPDQGRGAGILWWLREQLRTCLRPGGALKNRHRRCWRSSRGRQQRYKVTML